MWLPDLAQDLQKAVDLLEQQLEVREESHRAKNDTYLCMKTESLILVLPHVNAYTQI